MIINDNVNNNKGELRSVQERFPEHLCKAILSSITSYK